MNTGSTTLTLHLVAGTLHFISASLLLIFAHTRGWLIANEWSTCFSHFVGVVLWNRWMEQQEPMRYLNEWKLYESTRRWTEYMVTAGLLEVAILNTQESSQIVLILLLNAVLQIIGWLLDTYERNKILIPVGFVILGVQISLIALWSDEPTHTKIIYGVLYSLFGVVQTLDKFKKLPFDPDHIYTLLSITTKLILTWTIVAHDEDDLYLEWIIFSTAIVALIWGGALLYKPLDGRQNRVLPYN